MTLIIVSNSYHFINKICLLCYIMKMTNIRTLSEIMTAFTDALSSSKSERISVQYILDHFHERGIGIVLIFFSAPMALPIPVPPGINIILATPLVLLTVHQLLGAKNIYMPEKIRQKEVSVQKVSGMITGLIPWFKKLEILIKPRLGWITGPRWAQIFGLLAFIMALTVCIPVPLTNTVPSLGITLMSVGFMMRDGLAILGGAMIGMAWITMLVLAVLFFGPEAFDIIKETIKSFL